MAIGTLTLMDMFLTVTLLGSILTFETGGAFAGDPEHDTAILRFDVPRLLGMLERGTALALAVWVHPAALALPFIARGGAALARHGKERARLLAETGAGMTLTLVCWVIYAIIEATAGAI